MVKKRQRRAGNSQSDGVIEFPPGMYEKILSDLKEKERMRKTGLRCEDFSEMMNRFEEGSCEDFSEMMNRFEEIHSEEQKK